MHISLILGARPNFVKYAALHAAAGQFDRLRLQVVHTGQHALPEMSQVFFDELSLPAPTHRLGIAGGQRAEQIAQTMAALTALWRTERPDRVLVVGDVNASLAGALAADALDIPVVHYEAGLRSFDRRMPEERNRMLIDAASTLLLCTEGAGCDNLLAEGRRQADMQLVGNLLADTLRLYAGPIGQHALPEALGLKAGGYLLVTLHRPSNVDEADGLGRLFSLLRVLTDIAPVVFPVHPRTLDRLERSGMKAALRRLPNLNLLAPQPWTAFQALQRSCALVITDSGCVQEETTITGTPCLTFRENTERPVTATLGTNVLLPDLSPEAAGRWAERALAGNWKQGALPPWWDGHAASRVWAAVLGR